MSTRTAYTFHPSSLPIYDCIVKVLYCIAQVQYKLFPTAPVVLQHQVLDVGLLSVILMPRCYLVPV